MPSLADLVEEYDFLINDAVQRIERGDSIFFERSRVGVSGLFLGEATESVSAAFAALYTRVQKMEALHPGKLAAVVEAVYCPALEDAIACASCTEPLSSPDVQTFVSKLSERYALRNDGYISSVQLFYPLRAAVFLELLIRHPDAIPRIRASSAYLPHHLLKKEKISLSGLEHEIAVVIPTLYSEDDIALVTEANRFFEYGTTMGIRIDKYSLTQGFGWREGVTTGDFARLFDTPSAKAAVLSTLLSCLQYIEKTTITTGQRSPKKLKYFHIRGRHYAMLRHVLQSYAKNQIMQQLRQDAATSRDTTFTRYAGIHGTVQGGVIVLIHHHTGGTEQVSVHAKEYNTSTNLPTCVAMFAHLYNTAVKLACP